MPGKVLIITYYWPPSGGAGVQRWLKFVKYLRQYGWEPIIYTPLNPEYPAIDSTLAQEIPEDILVIKTPIWEPYKFYKKLTGIASDEKVNASGFISESKRPGKLQMISMWLRGNFFIPDARKFWIKPSIKYLNKWLSANHVDAMVSTGPPHSMHLIALELRKRSGIPWLADFRDPWTNIDFYQDLQLTQRADRKHHRQELSVLKAADDVVVISKSMKADFKEILSRQYTVITNGYDESDTIDVKVTTDSKFSIAHIGSMAKSRNPENLWIALNKLSETIHGFSEDLVIKLVGSVDYSVIMMLQKYNLIDKLQKIDYLPHDKVIEIQKQSRVLLLLINDTPNAKVILPGKFFEYMASGRPILCIGPMDGDAAQIIDETHSGLVADINDQADIIHKLKQLYSNYKENKDDILISNISQFSREQLSKTMALRLDHISKTKG